MRLGAPCAAIVSLLAAAALLSCQGNNSDPDLLGAASREEALMIYGYVTDADVGGPIVDAYVVWQCETCGGQTLGTDFTDDEGRYEIYGEGWSSSHPGHNFYGTASKPRYETGEGWIYDFDPSKVPYRKDFALWPE